MNNTNLTLGSLFDGSGGFPLGGLPCGITPVWASEIEPFPIRVTTKRLPGMKHLGDISTVNGAEIEPVDIITFGSPCTDMSVAGKRAGLDGSQSCLFYQAIRIVKEMRCATNGRYPRYIVWENVPGAFSSNKGEDFKAVLEAVCSVKDGEADIPRYAKWPNAGEILADDYSVAWRVLDAQYWGVPQRRKRIYLVADFAGGSAGKILFESEGVSGYTPQGFRSWEGTAGGAADRAGTSGGICLNDQGGSRMDVTEEVAATLRAEDHGHPPVVMEQAEYTGAFHINQRGEGIDLHDVSGALMATRNEQMQTFVTEKKAAGFCTEHSAKSRSIGFEEELSPTLRAGTVPAAVMFENHSQDARYTGPLDTAPTVSSTYGTGGNNQPFVVETPKTLKIRSGCEGGGKGALVQDNKSATLSCNNDQTVFVPFCKGTRPHSAEEAPTWKDGEVANTLNAFDVGESRCNELVVQAYGICSKDSNAMKSDNPHSGFYEAETSRTLDANGGNPSCNQGGMVVIEGNGSRPSHQGDGYSESETMYTLNATEQHAVAYGIDRATYNMGQNAQFNIAVEEEVEPTLVAKGPGAVAHPAEPADGAAYCMTTGDYTQVLKEQSPTLMARDYKDPPVTNGVQMEYIVRRLTPTECARLQGFPDWWCDDLGTENPTEEELSFWREVFETHRKIMGTSSKPKTDKQILKWLKEPHSDSAEYKMWGNGVALPNVYFVLSGIVYYSQFPDFLL